jgi:hypothetical protein
MKVDSTTRITEVALPAPGFTMLTEPLTVPSAALSGTRSTGSVRAPAVTATPALGASDTSAA